MVITSVDIQRIESQVARSDMGKALVFMQMQPGITVFKDTSGDIYKRHASTRSNLWSVSPRKPEVTPWNPEVNWSKFYKSVDSWMHDHYIPPLAKSGSEYLKNQGLYPLNTFTPVLGLESYYPYGRHNGKIMPKDWETSMRGHLSRVAGAFPWLEMDGSEFKYEHYDTYDELLIRYPHLSVLNTDSTTAYPFYLRQTPKVILEHYGYGMNSRDSDITCYFRRHGGSMKEGRFVVKVRTVYGVAFPMKVNGSWITWSWKYNTKYNDIPWMDPKYKHSVSPYYKDAKFVFDDILAKYVALDDDDLMFTTDQSRFDVNHRGFHIDMVKDEFAKSIPTEYQPQYEYIRKTSGRKTCKYWFTGTNYVKDSVDKRISGGSDIPSEETATNIALHLTQLEMQGYEPEWYNCQIDDIVMKVNGVSDEDAFLKEFSKGIYDNAGFEINPVKTETNRRGYLSYLQTNIGGIYQNEETTGNINDMQGVLWRRVHRQRFRERTRLEGELYVDGSNVPIHVQMLSGNLASLINVPPSLWEVFREAYAPTRVWHDLVELVQTHTRSDWAIGDSEGVNLDIPEFLYRYADEIYATT